MQKKVGSGWGIETVDSTGDVGRYTSITVDVNGNPHITYLDVTNVDLRYAKKTGGSWSIETVDAAGSVGYYTSIDFDANSNPHISCYTATGSDLKYATTALNIIDPIGGETWNVGANENIRWAGPRDIDAYISLQGGDDWIQLFSNIAGTAEGDSFYYGLRIPHFPTGFAGLKLVYAGFDPNGIINYSVSDTFFTITSTIAKLSFTAKREEGGVLLTYETDPVPPEIAGYNIYRSGDEGKTYEKINEDIITETSYKDEESGEAILFYQLGAINNLGNEYIIGATSTVGYGPLMVYPNPWNTGRLNIVYGVPHLPGEDKLHVRVRVYSACGRFVRELVNEKKESGYYFVTWDGKTRDNRRVSQGVYFMRVDAGGSYSRVEKIEVIR